MNENFSTPSSNYFNIKKTPFSSIRRNDNNRSSSSNFNFQLLCIKDLTKEILEAEDEPVIKVPLTEEEQTEDELESEFTTTHEFEVKAVQSNRHSDLGVACLNTPETKQNEIFKCPQSKNRIFCSTPNLSVTHKDGLSVPKVIITSDSEQFLINNVCYKVLKILGKGGSATVYHCLDTHNNNERAVKVVNLSSDLNTVACYENEVKLLKQLQNCKRIIRMYDYEYVESEKKLFLVLEKGGSDLSKILKNATSSSKKIHWIAFYWMEMLYAVQEIHQYGIIHADLKPANFLQVQCGLKLIDFGIALKMQNEDTSIARSTPIGSFNYISPEALTNRSSVNIESPSYGKPKYKMKYKSDVWSLGCILYQLVYGKTPFGYIQHMWAKLSMIIDPQHKIEYPSYDGVPQKFVNTIKSCLQYNVKDRPSIDELIKDYENLYF